MITRTMRAIMVIMKIMIMMMRINSMIPFSNEKLTQRVNFENLILIIIDSDNKSIIDCKEFQMIIRRIYLFGCES